MRKTIFSVLSYLVFSACVFAQSGISVPALNEDAYNFIVVNDLGRNGYYKQKPIAEVLGEYAGEADAEFIAALGDVHHFDGVASTSDPLWLSNYETIYKHPELMIEWNAICGNHEYRGNTQAVLDYSKISRRWESPAKYFSKTVTLKDGGTAVLVFIDTTPLIDKYRKESEKYPDASKEDMEKQLNWIDSTLQANQNAKWRIVMGHHPVYAQTPKDNSERTDLQKRLEPLFIKNNVSAYLCGHIHNFQHLKAQKGKVDYFVNSSGSLARKVSPVKETVFCSPKEGFMLVSMDDKSLSFFMVDEEGKTIYTYKK
ncbi:MAG: metallophosphoesterase [Bacteroidales bacterium]